MCGIIGVISNREYDLKKFIEMRDTLIHRGPDDEGVYFNDIKNVVLGHRRLSIIDLSPLGKQPMSNEDGSIWITFNGEIYNFKSIKEDLIEKGHKFKSETDTEVIIHGYEEWGIKVLDRLRGMFAFGIWDDNKKEFFLARDRLGIKPVYYYHKDEKFIFASEIKAIIADNTIPREIDLNSLRYFLKYAYIPAPYSIWENIHKLPPAHYLIIKDNQLIIEKYWEIKVRIIKESENQLLEEIEELLKKSIEYRFISDVPVGILLSGGLDSSIVTALSSEIKEELMSFSMGFELEEYSELNYARIVAKEFKTKSIESILDSSKLKDLMDDILFYYDEPLGVSSIFPTFLLMETASKHVKVALSGDGGDEAFAGYVWYQSYLKNRKYNFLTPICRSLNYLMSRIFPNPQNKYIKYIKRKIEYFALSDFDKYRQLTTPRFEDNELNELLNVKISPKSENKDIFLKYGKNGLKTVKDLQFLDINTFLSDCILVKVDRASMAHSLEVRVPFLDHFLLEYMMSLHPDIIFKNHELKHILKQIAKKKLPHEIIYRMKKGFSAPIVKLGFIDDNIHVLSDSIAVKDGIFKQDFINKIVRSNKLFNDAKLWLLILFELWYRKWKS